MKFEPVKLVRVYYKPQRGKIPVGRLALKSRKIFFEYDEDFLGRGIHLSPFHLPLKPGVIPSRDLTFDGLFGVFNDSLPDGWGRLLLDRMLMKHHINPGSLSALDRLCFVGNDGMGALSYAPETQSTPLMVNRDLDEIADEIFAFQKNEDDRFVEDLLILGGSSAGARPKVLLDIEQDHWIVKFRSTHDAKDIGSIEYAYHLMAIDAGLDVAPAKLFPAREGLGFFGTKRFDRMGKESIHMHTMSGLLHADHRLPSLDYQTMMQATMYLTRDLRQCEKLFRYCVFNVLSHNRDDHAKNFSFLMDHDGTWRVSPAYDLTFSSGPGGEHCSMIMGEGKNPGVSHLLELSKVSSIKKSDALKIIDEAKSAVSEWPSFAKRAGVGLTSMQMIQSALTKIVTEKF